MFFTFQCFQTEIIPLAFRGRFFFAVIKGKELVNLMKSCGKQKSKPSD